MVSREDITVFIPTYKRWDKVHTLKLIDGAVLVCPKSQEEEYRKYNKDVNILVCPDEIEGNIARKRNWIKRQCKTKYLIMMDDDIKDFQCIEGRKARKMTKDEIINMFISGFIMMEDLGTVLWGVNLNSDLQPYREACPLSFISPVLGPFTAQKNVAGLWYDERLPLKEDYDLFLQVIQKYHKVLRLNKYSYITQHLTNAEGGCVSYRTMIKEEEQNKLLVKKWGKDVVKFNMKKSVNPSVKVPYKGV